MKKFRFFLSGHKTIIVEASDAKEARAKIIDDMAFNHTNDLIEVTFVDDGYEIKESES